LGISELSSEGLTAARLLLGCSIKFAEQKEISMLYWAVVFLVVAIIAGVLGFGGIAGAATDVAKVLFFLFLILFIVGLILGRASI
jgi:uncharacterized membrane protein YtjA (UPF0391 family)